MQHRKLSASHLPILNFLSGVRVIEMPVVHVFIALVLIIISENVVAARPPGVVGIEVHPHPTSGSPVDESSLLHSKPQAVCTKDDAPYNQLVVGGIGSRLFLKHQVALLEGQGMLMESFVVDEDVVF